MENTTETLNVNLSCGHVLTIHAASSLLDFPDEEVWCPECGDDSNIDLADRAALSATPWPRPNLGDTRRFLGATTDGYDLAWVLWCHMTTTNTDGARAWDCVTKASAAYGVSVDAIMRHFGRA